MNCVLLLVSLFMLLGLRAFYWAGGLEGNTAANGREIARASSCPPFVQYKPLGMV